jgi:hypothetical protein
MTYRVLLPINTNPVISYLPLSGHVNFYYGIEQKQPHLKHRERDNAGRQRLLV